MDDPAAGIDGKEMGLAFATGDLTLREARGDAWEEGPAEVSPWGRFPSIIFRPEEVRGVGEAPVLPLEEDFVNGEKLILEG